MLPARIPCHLPMGASRRRARRSRDKALHLGVVLDKDPVVRMTRSRSRRVIFKPASGIFRGGRRGGSCAAGDFRRKYKLPPMRSIQHDFSNAEEGAATGLWYNHADKRSRNFEQADARTTGDTRENTALVSPSQSIFAMSPPSMATIRLAFGGTCPPRRLSITLVTCTATHRETLWLPAPSKSHRASAFTVPR